MAPVWYAAWAWTLLFTHQSRGVCILFASKFMCYFTSAVYHCMDTEGLPGLHDFLYRLDVVMIGMAIWAPYAPLADQDSDLGRSMLGMLCCIFVAWYLFKPKDGNGSWIFPLYFVYYILIIGSIGLCVGFTFTWFVSAVLYAVGFASTGVNSVAVLPARMKPWHVQGVWGGHEDFHAMLLLADLVLCNLVIRHVNGASGGHRAFHNLHMGVAAPSLYVAPSLYS